MCCGLSQFLQFQLYIGLLHDDLFWKCCFVYVVIILDPAARGAYNKHIKQKGLNRLDFLAPCLFGTEGLLADELRRMGAQEVLAENGAVLFSGGDDLLARANICSRIAERILVVVGNFEAHDFEQLFSQVRALPWERYIGSRDAFPVKGWSLHSTLHSVPDCQSIIKKAIVERLKPHYGIQWFEESGAKNQIQFSAMKNRFRLMIDTSGEGLHKRGYRAQATAAPIKETLAAAMAYAARIYPDSVMYDPFCGSGTILIESALIANHIAPGLHRGFAAQGLPWVKQTVWRQELDQALSDIRRTSDFKATGSDIDPQALRLCERNAMKAGVGSCIRTVQADIRDFTPDDGKGLVITNPPYGERLLDMHAAQQLYRVMGRRFIPQRGWRYYIISPDEQFETLFGKKADKRRKLYNGMIKCQLYMYFKR